MRSRAAKINETSVSYSGSSGTSGPLATTWTMLAPARNVSFECSGASSGVPSRGWGGAVSFSPVANAQSEKKSDSRSATAGP